MDELTDRLTEAQANYSREYDTASLAESSGNSDIPKSDTTKVPQQPASIYNSEALIRSSTNSLPKRSHSFPFQPTTLIDDRLRELSLKYEIQQNLAERLRVLEDYEIILLCDDSGSMKTKIDNRNRTRWDELKDFVQMILEIGTIFDETGVDIHFLNRRAILNVTDPNSVENAFLQPPRGYTPLVTALEYIFTLPAAQRGYDKKALIFIATDGTPTDNKGNINVNELEYLLNHRRNLETTHIMFLICTDDPTCVDYLYEWDKNMINVDVTDEFKKERDKIRQCKGKNFPFSKGDYIVKALIGAVDPVIDNLNEPDP